jgi:hypothetical protein
MAWAPAMSATASDNPAPTAADAAGAAGTADAAGTAGACRRLENGGRTEANASVATAPTGPQFDHTGGASGRTGDSAAALAAGFAVLAEPSAAAPAPGIGIGSGSGGAVAAGARNVKCTALPPLPPAPPLPPPLPSPLESAVEASRMALTASRKDTFSGNKTPKVCTADGGSKGSFARRGRFFRGQQQQEIR